MRAAQRRLDDPTVHEQSAHRRRGSLTCCSLSEPDTFGPARQVRRLVNNSATEAKIHPSGNPPMVEGLEPSFPYQTVAISRLVEILCLVEANSSDQLR